MESVFSMSVFTDNLPARYWTRICWKWQQYNTQNSC